MLADDTPLEHTYAANNRVIYTYDDGDIDIYVFLASCIYICTLLLFLPLYLINRLYQQPPIRRRR